VKTKNKQAVLMNKTDKGGVKGSPVFC